MFHSIGKLDRPWVCLMHRKPRTIRRGEEGEREILMCLDCAAGIQVYQKTEVLVGLSVERNPGLCHVRNGLSEHYSEDMPLTSHPAGAVRSKKIYAVKWLPFSKPVDGVFIFTTNRTAVRNLQSLFFSDHTLIANCEKHPGMIHSLLLCSLTVHVFMGKCRTKEATEMCMLQFQNLLWKFSWLKRD